MNSRMSLLDLTELAIASTTELDNYGSLFEVIIKERVYTAMDFLGMDVSKVTVNRKNSGSQSDDIDPYFPNDTTKEAVLVSIIQYITPVIQDTLNRFNYKYLTGPEVSSCVEYLLNFEVRITSKKHLLVSSDVYKG